MSSTNPTAIPQRQPPAQVKILCPHCKAVLDNIQMKFDPTPIGTFLLTFGCGKCMGCVGVQLCTKDILFPESHISDASGKKIHLGPA